MNPSIKEIVDAAVKEFGIVFAKDDIVDNAHMLGIGNWLRTALEAAFNRGKEEATKEWAEGDAKEEIKMYQRGQADIIQKLKGKVEGMKERCELCGEITAARQHLDHPDHDTSIVGFNIALSQVIQLLQLSTNCRQLPDNSQEKKGCCDKCEPLAHTMGNHSDTFGGAGDSDPCDCNACKGICPCHTNDGESKALLAKGDGEK